MLELSLNLCWLLLFAPALCLWFRRRSSSRQSVVTLVCLLALLFPVISVTDDLHAMRQEMEESSSSKRMLKHAGPHPLGAGVAHAQPAHATSAASVPSCGEICGRIQAPPLRTSLSARTTFSPGRAPPASILA
jgi:hypothetical protein